MYLLYVLEFILFVIFILMPIGILFIKLLKSHTLSFWEEILIAINLGSILFAVFIFITWYFKLYSLSYLLCVLAIAYSFYLIIKSGKKHINLGNFHIDIIPLLSIIFVSLICLTITINSGDEISGGIRFYGANGHDGLSFLALEQEIQRSIPPENPTYSGVNISNYHYLVYILISGIGFISKIPLPILNFKIIIPFFIFLYSTSIYFLIYKISSSKLIGVMGLLLSTISGNIYYIAPLLSKTAVLSPSVFWVNEYLTRMVNPQLLFSYIVLLTIFLIILHSNYRGKKFILLLGFLIGTLIIIKAFAAVLFLGALFILALLELRNKDYIYLKIFGMSLVFSVFFYLLAGNKASSILIFSPLCFIKNMYESPDHLNFPDWELRRQLYLSKNNLVRVFQLYLQGLIVFILGNLGGRFLGLFAFDNSDRKLVRDIKLFIIMLGIVAEYLWRTLDTARRRPIYLIDKKINI